MNKSQRIKISLQNDNEDKQIQVRLEQDTDTLEFMSLKLDTKEAYNKFNSDYGVVVGRVTANGGIGIPNARISIFIPLEESDENNGDIVSIYPYKNPRDKNKEGKRYNLLPRVAKIDPETGIVTPKQPFGSFPIKEEFVTNETYLEVYEKYYKYSTITNQAGDYMIFGVPVGTQIVHMSCDITDIGEYSMTPAAMITNLGYSPNLFNDDGTKIKPSTDLDDLPNIETQEISVDVIPFWGDSENFVIGITRQDFRIRAQLTNTFIVFGSIFTDGYDSMWGEDFNPNSRVPRELYRARNPAQNTIGIATKRIGRVTENIYYYPNTISDSDIPNVDPRTAMVKLDKTEYSVYKRDGDFVFIINCNRRKVVTDEFGNETIVPNDSTVGAFTEFKGFITLEITEDTLPMNFTGSIGNNITLNPFRFKLKFPQSALGGSSFDRIDDFKSDSWRKQHATFRGGEYYSVAQFYSVVYNSTDGDGPFDNKNSDDFFNSDVINSPYHYDPFWMTGTLNTRDDSGALTGNTAADFPSNTYMGGGGTWEGFAANWMNFSIHLPQMSYATGSVQRINDMRSNTNFTANPKNTFYFRDNTQGIAGGDFNTKHFARSDIHYTAFIRAPKTDIRKILDTIPEEKGFTSDDITLEGDYKNGQSPVPRDHNGAIFGGGGRTNGIPGNPVDTKFYFYRGFDTADCLQYLELLGLV